MPKANIEQLAVLVATELTELRRELREHNYDRAYSIAAWILHLVEDMRELETTQSQEVAQ